MKITKILFLIFVLGFTINCKKDEPDKAINLSVDEFVELLKTNQYDSFELPVFTYKDIPALLNYRNEVQLITGFPHNMLSSLWMPECELGIYVLWIIEAIRSGSINNDMYIEQFPSLNPILAKRSSQGTILASEDGAREIAAQAYFKWWEDNRNKEFGTYKNIDPLSVTDYRWR